MIPAPVRYHRASSLEDALAMLAEPEARALAGGQSLIPVLKLRIARPELVVDLGGLDLARIELSDETVRLGALATWDALVRSPELERPALAAIGECAARIGDLQVRNRGTIGGSLAHADPASDMPAVLLALGASVVVRSPEGERDVSVDDLLVGPFTTSLVQQELITAVLVPVPAPGSASAYDAVEHPASGFALAGAAAVVAPDGRARVAVTGVSSRPLLLAEGLKASEALDSIEVVGDGFAPAEFRRELAAVVVQRALERARRRAEESRP